MRSGQGAGGEEHAEPAGVDGEGSEGGRALQKDQAGLCRGGAVVGGAFSPGPQRAAETDHSGSGQHGRSAARESGGALLSRLLWALLLSPVVYLLWGTPFVRAAAPGEYRWRGGKRGGTRPPGAAASTGVAAGADHRAR